MNFRNIILLSISILSFKIANCQLVNIKPTYEWMLKDITYYKISIDTTNYKDFCIVFDKHYMVNLDTNGILTNSFPNTPINLRIYKKDGQNLKFIADTTMHGTYHMPRPTAKINGIYYGAINLDTLINSEIKADYYKYKIDKKYKIENFDFIITRRNKTIFAGNSDKGKFLDEQKNKIKDLVKTGDRILFYNIITDDEYLLNNFLNSIELIINE